jgi:hypothetical protein
VRDTARARRRSGADEAAAAGYSAVQRGVQLGLAQVSQNGQLLSRRDRSIPANASGFDTHRDSISSRFDCSTPRRRGGGCRWSGGPWGTRTR